MTIRRGREDDTVARARWAALLVFGWLALGTAETPVVGPTPGPHGLAAPCEATSSVEPTPLPSNTPWLPTPAPTVPPAPGVSRPPAPADGAHSRSFRGGRDTCWGTTLPPPSFRS